MNVARSVAFPPCHFPAAEPAARAAGAVETPDVADPHVRRSPLPASECPVEPSNDPLGIVSGHLAQQDRLTPRQADAPVRPAVDAKSHTLILSGRQARETLSRPGALHDLKTLRLTSCEDADLVDLAKVLRAVPHPSFELVLVRDAGTRVTAQGLQAIAAAHLSDLSLQGIPIPPDAAHALSHGGFPVSIALPHRADGTTDVDRISRIPTLTSLDGGGQPVSDTAIRTLRSHAALLLSGCGWIRPRWRSPSPPDAAA